MFMTRLVASASRLASQEQAEPRRFFELARWAAKTPRWEHIECIPRFGANNVQTY
jgi:hypothetical protein